MRLLDLHNYICCSGLDPEQQSFIKKELERFEADAWMSGYKSCLWHMKKRKELVAQRTERYVKSFLDYLFDLTHNKH